MYCATERVKLDAVQVGRVLPDSRPGPKLDWRIRVRCSGSKVETGKNRGIGANYYCRNLPIPSTIGFEDLAFPTGFCLTATRIMSGFSWKREDKRTRIRSGVHCGSLQNAISLPDFLKIC